MISQEADSTAPKLVSKALIKTKSRFKQGKALSKSPEKQQPAFNDPLYEYLDNQVYNKEEHNFGPWIQEERKTSHKNRQNQHTRNLPLISPLQYQLHIQHNLLEENNYALPNIDTRPNRISSLRQLRSISIELQAQRQSQQFKFRRERSLSRQPFFLKGHGTNWGIIKTEEPSGRKSNFNYNYCLRQQDASKLLTMKLKPKGQSYLKLQQLVGEANKESRSQVSNRNLLRELKEYRQSKLK